MRRAHRVALVVLGFGLGFVSAASAQVRASGEAFSTRVDLGGAPLPPFYTGDTANDDGDAEPVEGEDFALEDSTPGNTFAETVVGEVIELPGVIDINGGDFQPGDSVIGGTADGTASAVTSTAGAATVDVLPSPIAPSAVEVATRDAQVEIDCDAFTATSAVNVLEIGGTPVEVPGEGPCDALSEDFLILECNTTDVDVFDSSPLAVDGDDCGITVTQTAFHAQVLPPEIAVILDVKVTSASATLDNLPCTCAVLGLPTPTPTATGTATPTLTPTPTDDGGGGAGGSGGAGGAGGAGGTGGAGGAGGGFGTPGVGGGRLITTGSGGCSIGPDGQGGAGLPFLAALAFLVWRAVVGKRRRSA